MLPCLDLATPRGALLVQHYINKRILRKTDSMLQSIRDGIKGWLSTVIIGIIVVPFAFWGVTSYFSGGGEVTVAKVGDGEISQRAFQRSYQSRYQAEQRRLGDAADQIDERALKFSVLENMVSTESLTQHVLDDGYDVADAQLLTALQENPYLQENGRFSETRYGQFLAAVGMDAVSYEASLRRSLRVGQLQSGVTESMPVTDAELERLWKLQNQERTIAAATIDLAALAKKSKVTDDAIKAWYEEHAENYWSEEQIRVDYVELNVADLSSRVAVSEDELNARYEEDKGRYITPEQRRASHILISSGDDADAAKTELEALKARIEAGESFADLAKEHSDDPGSATAGGDLGMVGRGVMVKSFEEALFALAETGDISDLVETQFGFHLIRLDEIQAEQGRSFDDTRLEIETVLREEKAEELYSELLDQLSEMAYETPDNLTDVAAALELEVRTSGWFSRETGSGISAEPAVRKAAFGNVVAQDDENSELIEVGDNTAIVLRKNDYRASTQKPLADVREQIKTQLGVELAIQKSLQMTDAVLSAVEEGKSFAQAAKAQGLDVEDHGAIKRDSRLLGAAALQDAFSIERPKATKASVGTTVLADGNVVIYAVSKVAEPVADAAALEKDKVELKAQLKTFRGRAELFATLRDIREGTDVKLYPDRL